jgi:hypothetical protein
MRLSRPWVALIITSLAALAALALTSAARADVLITIDKSTQQMTVEDGGALLYTWPVSTGAPGYDTPSGEFKPFRMERDHFSREWDDAPMPHSIFFTQEGHAIHGSGHVRAIGTPASHGCVRLAPKNASILFDLVKQEGMSHTHVVLSGETPYNDAPVTRRNRDKENGIAVASDDGDDPDMTAAMPPPRRSRASSRGWHRAGPRYYYVQRRYYGRPFFPFGW